MRIVFLAILLLSFSAFAQQANQWLDKAEQPGCCNRRPFMQVDAQPGMPRLGVSGRAVKLKTFLNGWSVAGTDGAYELSCDLVASNCGIAILRSTARSSPDTYGALLHRENATPWRGTRVRLRAELRAGRVDAWAGAWIRAEDKDGKLLAARTMRSVALKGTTSFEWAVLEFEVPEDAESLVLGVELQGGGAIFVREVQLESAATGVVTSR